MVAWSALSITAKQVGRVEPWPAWLLPGFAGSPSQLHEIVVVEPALTATFSDGGHESVSAGALLAPIRRPPALVLTSAFSAGLDENGHLIETERRSVPARVTKGLPHGQTPWGTARAHDPLTVAWIADRLQQMTGRNHPVALRIEWWKVTRAGDAQTVTARELVRVVTVDLLGASAEEEGT